MAASSACATASGPLSCEHRYKLPAGAHLRAGDLSSKIIHRTLRCSVNPLPAKLRQGERRHSGNSRQKAFELRRQ